ncbi:MAG: glycosyltransferase family 4 protein [Pelotomaculum sp.]|jgi:glycosyltransferase involved in cell wall biosynthesis
MYFDKAGRHYWFAKNLIKSGYKPTIFCASTNHFSDKNVDMNGEKYIIDSLNGIPFIFIKTSDYKGNGKSRAINMVSFYKNLFPVTKEYAKAFGKPDVILASSVHPLTLVAGIKIAKRFGVPCICEVRDLWPEAIFAFNKSKEKSLIGRILVAGEHWIYKNAAALVFTKEGDTDYIKEKKWDAGQGGAIDLKKAYYINNGVDIDAFNDSMVNNILEDIDLNADKFNVVYVGAIRPVNNVGNILDAAALLKNDKDIQFLIYGDGTQKEMLEKRIVDEGLSNVKMKGFVNKQFIPYILSKSSINILNYSQTQYNWSRGNSSNKLFEYMASGKPIISTVKMGYSIINKYKCGLELKNASGEDLANAILKIKNIPEEEYKEIGLNAKTGAKDFDFKILTGKLIEVINSVMGEK